MKSDEHNAVDIANWFIARANKEKVQNFGEGISNLKLQKILYFAQAASLALDKKPLFKEEIYAWNYGPVVEEVYHAFKHNMKTPIKNTTNEDYTKFDAELVAFLEDIWSTFAKYSAGKLVEMTHAHAPWKDAYQSNTISKVIKKDVIQNYYQNVFVRTT